LSSFIALSRQQEADQLVASLRKAGAPMCVAGEKLADFPKLLGYTVDVTGRGCSSAMSRRMSTNGCTSVEDAGRRRAGNHQCSNPKPASLSGITARRAEGLTRIGRLS